MSKNYEFVKIEDMVYARSEAIEKCNSLAKEFIIHFKKICEEPKSQAVNHWCDEMQGWLNEARDITLKHNNKKITFVNLIDWFFTKGQTVEELFESEMIQDKYNDFISKIAKNNYDVKITIKEIFGDQNG